MSMEREIGLELAEIPISLHHHGQSVDIKYAKAALEEKDQEEGGRSSSEGTSVGD
jgi:hypothetical protein